jgi:HK97 family phage prohead protease
MLYPFQVSDESLNSFSFRVMTDGIDTTLFDKNSIMLYMHERGKVIGRWVNLRKENGILLADAEFDSEDEDAIKIEKKVKKGLLKMASIGFTPTGISEEPELMLSGQQLPTVVTCILKEISIVDIGSNVDCLKIYDMDGNVINLADGGISLKQLFNQNSTIMKKLIGLLMTLFASVGITLSDDSNEDNIFDAVKGIVDKNRILASEILDLKGQLKVFQDKQLAEQELKIVALVDKAIADKKITGGQKDVYLSLAKSNFDSVKNLFDTMKPYESIETQVGKGGGDLRKDWTLADWQKKDSKGLLAMKKNNWPEYERLFETEHGSKPKKSEG